MNSGETKLTKSVANMRQQQWTKPLGSNPTDKERFMHLMTMGFRMPKPMQKIMICQLVTMCMLLLAWLRFNGGFYPWFLRKAEPKDIGSARNLLEHFPDAVNEGSKIRWAHGINSGAALQEALKRDVHMLEADVLLHGQDTEEMTMEPVMAHPPDVLSDITLKQWLDVVKKSGKGFKLDFKSIQAVEISLQHLREIQEELQAPVHLSAKVLPGPNSERSSSQDLDVQRFLRLCTEHFPQSTLALGWTDAVYEGGVKRYSWSEMKQMHDLIDRRQISQPVTFNIRAGLSRHSASQLRWLAEMTGGTLTVFSQEEDIVPVEDLLYLEQRIPANKLFMDLGPSVDYDEATMNEKIEKVSADIYNDMTAAFKGSKWRVIKSREGETIYLGTESVILQKGLLITRDQYPVVSDKPLRISGRMEFLEPSSMGEPEEQEEGGQQQERGLDIVLRVTQSTRQDSISGIKCFLGFRGSLEIRTQGIPGADASAKASIPGEAPCLKFQIVDTGKEKISLHVKRPKSCEDMSTTEYEATVELPMSDISTDSSYLAIRTSHGKIFTAIDQFHIQL